MEELRPDALETVAARVVAWHNRNPLARRIKAEQVQSVGFVSLPYLQTAAPEPAAAPAGKDAAAASAAPAADGGKSLRERAVERARQGGGPAEAAPAAAPPAKGRAARPAKPGLRAVFTEDFIAPLSPRRVARWAARHGLALGQAPRGAPLRVVEPDAKLAPNPREVQTLFVLTALVETRGQRIRLLLSPGTHDAVLGTHLWDRLRLGGAAGALATLLLGATAAVLLMRPAPPGDMALGDPAVASAASAAASGKTSGKAADAASVATAAPVWSAQAPAAVASWPSLRPPSMRASAAAALGLVLPTQPSAAPLAPVPEPEPAAAPARVAATPAQGATKVGAAASAAAAPAAPVAVAQRPPDVEPTLGRVVLPSLGLPRQADDSPEARARQQATRAAVAAAGASEVPVPPSRAGTGAARAATRAEAPATSPAPPPGTPPGTAPGSKPGNTSAATRTAAAGPLAQAAGPSSAAAVTAAAPAKAGNTAASAAASARAGPVPVAGAQTATPPRAAFALTSRRLRTRAESELTMVAMKSLLITAGHRDVHVEVVPSGEDWRVVSWPFAQRAQAERAQGLLATRGMRLEVVDF